jgi:hypothetical protein
MAAAKSMGFALNLELRLPLINLKRCTESYSIKGFREFLELTRSFCGRQGKRIKKKRRLRAV